MRIFDWLQQPPQWQERAARYTDRGVVACYWDGTGTTAHTVKDVSLTGAYLYTAEPWRVGTIIVLTLKGGGECERTAGSESVSIPCRVARHGPDGVGVNFMLHVKDDRKALERFISKAVQATPLGHVAGRGAGTQGQALVEFALLVPFLFLLIFNAVNFGGFLYNWIAIANAARVGAQSAGMGAAYASYPPTATLAAIKAVIQNETSSLPGASAANPAVTVCELNNGNSLLYPPTGSSPAACPGGIAAPPQDPETITGVAGASHFTSLAIDVTFTYTGLIPAFSSGALSVFLPPSPIHIRTVMRVLN